MALRKYYCFLVWNTKHNNLVLQLLCHSPLDMLSGDTWWQEPYSTFADIRTSWINDVTLSTPVHVARFIISYACKEITVVLNINLLDEVHPSIFCCLSGTRSQWLETETSFTSATPSRSSWGIQKIQKI